MKLVRRHLRLAVAVWIAFQAAALSAFVPRDCCFAHRVPAQEEALDATCHHPEPASAPEPECSLRGACNGPLAMLAALLSPHAVLAEPTRIPAAALVTAPHPRPLEQPLSRSRPPDSPPPRG
jgi:hypothetical protein